MATNRMRGASRSRIINEACVATSRFGGDLCSDRQGVTIRPVVTRAEIQGDHV